MWWGHGAAAVLPGHGDRQRGGNDPGVVEAWMEDGMKAYEHGLKKKLMWLIYIIPMVVFTAAFYIVNYM